MPVSSSFYECTSTIKGGHAVYYGGQRGNRLVESKRGYLFRGSSAATAIQMEEGEDDDDIRDDVSM